MVRVLSVDCNELKIKLSVTDDKGSAATAVIEESFKILKNSYKQPINSV